MNIKIFVLLRQYIFCHILIESIKYIITEGNINAKLAYQFTNQYWIELFIVMSITFGYCWVFQNNKYRQGNRHALKPNYTTCYSNEPLCTSWYCLCLLLIWKSGLLFCVICLLIYIIFCFILMSLFVLLTRSMKEKWPPCCPLAVLFSWKDWGNVGKVLFIFHRYWLFFLKNVTSCQLNMCFNSPIILNI